MSKNPNDPAYWTPARRKKHSERLEEYYEATLQQPGWDAYIAVTSGRWDKKARSRQGVTLKRVWASRTPAERERIKNKQRLGHLEKKIALIQATGAKVPYALYLRERELRGTQ